MMKKAEQPLVPDVLKGRLVIGDLAQLNALKELDAKPRKQKTKLLPWYYSLNQEQINMITALGGRLYDPNQ